jgi:two-component system phosphate regulon sensor histidine kinase PhoR
MNRPKLIRQIFPPYLIVIVLSLLIFIGYASHSFRNFHLDQIALELESRARILEHQINPHLSPLEAEKIDALCKSLGKSSSTRITVILPSGKVIGDSEESPDRMESHSTRQEILAAKAGKTGRAVHYSRTLEQDMIYLAIPLYQGENLAALLRTALPVTALNSKLTSLWGQLAAGGILVCLAAALIGLWIAKRISRPIEEMKEGAMRFAKGQLGKMRVPKTEELASLAEAMNDMARELDSRIHTIIRQKTELETVLASMVEGVIAVDPSERIISINASAAKMFEINPEASRGRTIQEVIRNFSLQKFIQKSLAKEEVYNNDIPFYHQEERIFSVRNSPIYDGQSSQVTGTLVVIDDVTKLRRLENMRKEFVANVSHEIKTPLTTIKGFVETLHNESSERDEKSRRFLEIILKHVDRLNAIVDDLLSLSKIEREKDVNAMILSPGNLKDVVHTAIGICRPKADEKKIEIQWDIPEKLPAMVDATLLEQAFVNLLDNAVKYSEESSVIKVRGETSGSSILIQIMDHGMGIPKEHLPRLFERFYRVDKARSRKMGGTGLGLAIVKHIVQAHNGSVTAESTPGKGSTFTVRLPVMHEGKRHD